MKKIKLACGLTCEVDERIANDFEVLWFLRKSDKDINYLFMALEKIFGSEATVDKLIECLKCEDGYVDNEKIGDVVTELFEQLGEDGKNS